MDPEAPDVLAVVVPTEDPALEAMGVDAAVGLATYAAVAALNWALMKVRNPEWRARILRARDLLPWVIPPVVGGVRAVVAAAGGTDPLWAFARGFGAGALAVWAREARGVTGKLRDPDGAADGAGR